MTESDRHDADLNAGGQRKRLCSLADSSLEGSASENERISGGEAKDDTPSSPTTTTPSDSDCESPSVANPTNGLIRARPLPKYPPSHLPAASNGEEEQFEEVSLVTAVMVYIAYAVLVIVGYYREFLRRSGLEQNKNAQERKEMKDFVPLFADFESFYTRNVFIRVRDCMNRPLAGVPGAEMDLVDRVTLDYGWTFKTLDSTTRVVNLGSYNYLGFAENKGTCASDAKESIHRLGVGICASVHGFGTTRLQKELEVLVARFIGVEDAICCAMGFATNATNIPCLVDKHSLILSDELNHSSIILGCRLSGACIRVFKHNDMNDLEEKLRDAILYGQRRGRFCHKPFNKILICVEGIYSMEGSIIKLREIIQLKKRYNAYIFLDEAHSIGAMGQRARGVCDYWHVDPKEVDVLMGTFTKSFGSAGGYIAGSRKLVEHLRLNGHATYYGVTMSPPVVQQVITSMRTMMGEVGSGEGQRRVRTLARNGRYFRQRLIQLGYIVYGNDDSPVVPLLLYYPTALCCFARELLHQKVGVVIACFPATPITLGRARLCVSASHTKDMLDTVIAAIEEASSKFSFRFSTRRLYGHFSGDSCHRRVIFQV